MEKITSELIELMKNCPNEELLYGLVRNKTLEVKTRLMALNVTFHENEEIYKYHLQDLQLVRVYEECFYIQKGLKGGDWSIIFGEGERYSIIKSQILDLRSKINLKSRNN